MNDFFNKLHIETLILVLGCTVVLLVLFVLILTIYKVLGMN